jgi:hypothetical protein
MLLMLYNVWRDDDVREEPMVDDKVHAILSRVAEGKLKNEIAKELGYKSYVTMDRYMQKKNYEWNKVLNDYVPVSDGSDNEHEVQYPVARVAMILKMLKKGMDPKEVANHLRFDSHQDMAQYLLSKGYVWDQTEGTYMFRGQPPSETEEESKQAEHHENRVQDTETIGKGDMSSYMERYIPLFELLDKHQDTLEALLSSQSKVGRIPRYVLPGVHITKSVHMIYGLDQLIREFSQEKNISQKDIFEVALVEFFKKYGYHKEIDTLLGS